MEGTHHALAEEHNERNAPSYQRKFEEPWDSDEKVCRYF